MADIFNEKLIINEKNNNEISQDIQNLFNTIVNKDFNNLKKMKKIFIQNIKVNVRLTNGDIFQYRRVPINTFYQDIDIILEKVYKNNLQGLLFVTVFLSSFIV
jgi:hypothetical protein